MISEKEKFFDPRKPFASKRPETHEEWQARMGGEVLAVVRSGLYLDFRFLDMALSALTLSLIHISAKVRSMSTASLRICTGWALTPTAASSMAAIILTSATSTPRSSSWKARPDVYKRQPYRLGMITDTRCALPATAWIRRFRLAK